MDMRDIEQRLAALEAKESIARTIHQYATSIDYGLDERWLDCFLEGGVFEVRSPTAPTLMFRGQAELAAMIDQHTKAPGRWHKHIVSQLDIDVRGDEATAQTYILRVDRDDADDDMPKVWVFGRYLDQFKLCDDGKWRFRHRIIELEGVHPVQRPLLGAMAQAS